MKNLASAVLGKTLARLSGDREERFGSRPWIMETFVDPAHFAGTSYKAAGFLAWAAWRAMPRSRPATTTTGGVKRSTSMCWILTFRSIMGLARKDEPPVPNSPDLAR